MSEGTRKPSLKEIAEIADVSVATVDRVLNARMPVREKTRQRVLEAMQHLQAPSGATKFGADISVVFAINSSETFRSGVDGLLKKVISRSAANAQSEVRYYSEMSGQEFARELATCGKGHDAVVIVGKTDPNMDRQISALESSGTPVICVTTDYPNSGRSCYVGMNQLAAGRVAGQLIGFRSQGEPENVILMIGHNSHCEVEREMGFRAYIRANFPNIVVHEVQNPLATGSGAKDALLRHLRENEPPIGVYSTSSGVEGMSEAFARADTGQKRRPLLVAHEALPHTFGMLAEGKLDALISANNLHVFEAAMASAIERVHSRRNISDQIFAPHIILRENMAQLDWF